MTGRAGLNPALLDGCALHHSRIQPKVMRISLARGGSKTECSMTRSFLDRYLNKGTKRSDGNHTDETEKYTNSNRFKVTVMIILME